MSSVRMWYTNSLNFLYPHLQFVWQSNRRVSGGHPPGDVACGIQHFPSAMLDIPEPLERRVYTSGAASPNIPPNPPTSPVEGESMDPRGSSKLNVNAPAFVPANLSIIKNSISAGPPKGGPLQCSPVKKDCRELSVDDRIAIASLTCSERFGGRDLQIVIFASSYTWFLPKMSSA